MTLQYTMRATIIATSKVIYWTSVGTADMTGQYSGHASSALTGISVDYVTDRSLAPADLPTPAGEVAGDLSGSYPSPIVVGLQGYRVSETTPSDGQVLTWKSTENNWAPVAPTGGSSSPGGSDTFVQFNDSGVLGGDSGLVFDKTNDILGVSGALTLGGATVTAGLIRVPHGQSIILSRNATDTADQSLLDLVGNELFVGTSSSYTDQVDSIRLYSSGSIVLGTLGDYVLEVSSTVGLVIADGKPLSFGTSAATTGNIRVGGATATNQIVWNDGTTDQTIVKTEAGGNGVEFGTISHPGSYYGSTTTIYSDSGPTYLYGAGVNVARLAADSSDFIRLGSSSATAGEIRLPSAASFQARDATNTADWNALSITGGTSVTLGDSVYGSSTRVDGASAFLYGTTNAGIYNTNGSGYALYVSSTDMTIGTTYTLQSGNADGSIVDVIRSIATTDATVTNLYTWTIDNNAVTLIDLAITACDDTASLGGSWKRSYTIRTAAGTVTAIGTVHDVQTDEDAAAWDVTVDDDGAGTGRVRVTGDVATNITWYGAIRLQVTPM